MATTLNRPTIVLLEHFKNMKESIEEIMSLPSITTFTKLLSNFTIIFASPESEEIINYLLNNIDLDENKINELVSFIKNSFRTSFSYGLDDKEFVFILVEEKSPLLSSGNQDGLLGLILHETLHSVQRQRGLETRLKNSLVFSLDFFQQLAELIPESAFDRNEIIVFLKKISQFALFTLKDVYVNHEMIKRGYCGPLIQYFKIELGFGEPEKVSPPIFSVPFERGKICIKDLDEFTEAFNFTISLIPAWLPFMNLDVEDAAYEESRKLKHFIFDHYYTSSAISLMTREMLHFENIFLTTFSFSKDFHRKWFGAIFNLGIEYLLGEDFVYYHLSKAAELIEEIYQNIDNDLGETDRCRLAMIPLLKATYSHRIEHPSGIQQKNIEELETFMNEKYNIDNDEIDELNEILASEETEYSVFFENLLQLSIMILARDLRRQIIDGNTIIIKKFGRVILTMLQAIFYLGKEKYDQDYYNITRLTIKRLVRNYDEHLRKALALRLEAVTKNEVLNTTFEASFKEAEELIFYYLFFNIPITNDVVDLGLSFINGIKIVAQKSKITDPTFPKLVSQFLQILYIPVKEKPEFNKEEVNMIVVSSLMATEIIPFNLVNDIVKFFVFS